MSKPDYILNEKDVLKSFQLLGHRRKEGEWTELRIIDTNSKQVKKQIWVNNKEDYLNVCREWNGKANIYHGLNPRPSNGAGKSADIKRITLIPIDIDPERPKDTASTQAQLTWAISQANIIKNWCRDQGFKEPIAAISGNGVHLLFSVDIEITNPDEFRDKVKIFYSRLPVGIDTSCSDPARIFKVYGTWSVKGTHEDETPHRIARILDLGDYEADERLASYILEGKIKKIDLSIDFEENTLEEYKQKLAMVRRNEKLNDFLNGDWKKYGEDKPKWSRSEAEYTLCYSLFFYGFTPDEVNQILTHESKIGKWRDAPESYRKKTLESCYTSYMNNPRRFFSDDKFVASRLSEEMQREHMFIATSARSEIWHYKKDKGIWKPDGEKIIGEICKTKLKSTWKSHYGNEASMHIRVSNYVEQDQLGSPKQKVVCLNGVYDTEKNTFSGFDPEIYAISQIPVTYDPEATCSVIDSFINEVVSEEDVNKIYELAGYCLFKSYPIARFAIFHGSMGSGGKSTTLKLITAMLGSDNVSSLNIQNLVDEGFRGSSLFQKLANISGDLPSKPISDTGFIKKCTGGDLITIEKKFKDPFDFYNHAKLIFSANEVPAPKYDDTGAFYRRTLLIEFPNHFPDGEPGTDSNIIDKLTTAHELSGFLNKAITGLKDLLTRGKFSKEKNVTERKRSYMMESNQIQYFAENFVGIDTNPDHYVTNEDLYRFYVYMCRNIIKIPKASNVFSREFRRWISYAYQGSTTIDKRKVKVWRGLTVDIVKLEYEYEIERPTDKQAKLDTRTDRTDRTDISPIKDSTVKNKISLKPLIPKTTVPSVPSVPEIPNNNQNKLFEVAKEYMKNNGNFANTENIVKHLTTNGYTFDDFKQLKKDPRIKMDQNIMRLVE